MFEKIQKNKELIAKMTHFGVFGVLFSLIPIGIALMEYQFTGTAENRTMEMAPDVFLVASAIVLNAIGILLSEFDDSKHPIFIFFLAINILSVAFCFYAYGNLINDSYAFTQEIFEIDTEYKETLEPQMMLAALKRLEDAKETMMKNRDWIFMMRVAIGLIMINSLIGFVAIPIAKRVKEIAGNSDRKGEGQHEG